MIKLNLGSGPYPMQGWDCLDLLEHPGIITHDLTTPLLYAGNSVDFAFSEHFLEHLTRYQGVKFLKEVHRVLKPGGVFRIVVPDLRLLCYNYMNNNHKGIPGCWEPKTPAQMINEGMREWGHQFLYDALELLLVCSEAGFNTAKFQEYRKSSHPELQNLELRPFNGELILEVTK